MSGNPKITLITILDVVNFCPTEKINHTLKKMVRQWSTTKLYPFAPLQPISNAEERLERKMTSIVLLGLKLTIWN